MHKIDRRELAVGVAAAIATGATANRSRAQGAHKRFRMLLNTSFSGPQAWILLAQDKGFLQREGVELDLVPGGGAYTAAPRMMSSEFDLGYGDINALIEVAAKEQGREPARAPVAVFVAFNASPSTVAVDPAGPVKSPKDLEGKTVIGHSSDVALRTFGAFCKRTGIDASRVKVVESGGGMLGMVESMLGSRGASGLAPERSSQGVHGVFGYVSTLDAAIAAGNRDPAKTVRHLRYADHVPELYGSALIVSRRMLRDEPAAVRGIVRALNAGLAALVQDVDAGIDAVMRRASWTSREVEKLRLMRTLEIEMASAEGKHLGIGDVDDARFARSIALLAETNRLPRAPAASEVFTREFLPPLNQRVTSLPR